MMRIRSLHGAAAGRITRLRLGEVEAAAPSTTAVRDAFESFVVMLWQMALAQDSIGGWARTCEHLYTMRLFLDRMRLGELAEMASDLMALAGCHAELDAMGDPRGSAKRAAQEAARTRAF
jgi:hypothetical protein